MKARTSEALVLFDIDGTLVRRAGPHHRQALVEAVRRVIGVETTTDHIPVQGMLDPDILTCMLRDAGARPGAVRRLMPELVERAESIYSRRCPRNLGRKVCPGARRLLTRLARRAVPLGLVTGNLRRIGWTKLERAGLKQFFRFGAFAADARDRAGLVRLALAEARRRHWINGASRVWLIGDHPNDILAARAGGVRSVAVATGLSPAAELASYNPDLLVDELSAVRLEMLLGA